MKTLVVTGGIGSGKSAVCRFFSSKGVPVYDSDSRARSIYDRCPAIVSRISEAFGEPLCAPDGRIDRRRLAEIVFSDSSRLERLEAIVHPAVLDDFLEWRDSFKHDEVPFVVMESAIILEKPLFRDIADFLLIVDAPMALRARRAALRDGVQESEIRKRMDRQRLLNDISEGRAHVEADYIIMNDGSEEELYSRVTEVYESVCEAARALQKYIF